MGNQALTVLQHATVGLARLAQQYKNRANVANLITAMLAEVQTLEQVANDLYNLRLLPNSNAVPPQAGASGAQLDRLGRILGVKRNGLGDASYLIRLRAQIILNVGSGTPLDLYALLDALLAGVPGSYSVLEEQFPRGVSMKAYGTPIATALDFAAVLKLAKDGGVNLVFEYATDIDANSFVMEPLGTYLAGAYAAGVSSVQADDPGQPTLTVNPGWTAGDASNPSSWQPYNNSGGLEPITPSRFKDGTGREALGGSGWVYRVAWSVANTTQKGILSIAGLTPPGGVAFARNKVYLFEFWARGAGGMIGQPGFSSNSNAPAPTINTQVVGPNITTNWQRYVLRVAYGNGQNADNGIYIGVTPYGGGQTGSVDFTDFRVIDEVSIAAGFPPSGSLVIDKGTATEETIAYSALSADGVVTLSAPTAKAHDVGAALQVAGSTGLGLDTGLPSLVSAAAGAGATVLAAGTTNLLAWSQDFSNAAWIKQPGLTVGAFAIAPDGTNTAQTINDSTPQAAIVQNISALPGGATLVTWSMWLRNSVGGVATLQIYDSTTAATLATLAVNAGAAWQRYSVSVVVPAGHATQTVLVIPLGGSVIAWGPQYEPYASAPTPYLPTAGIAPLTSPAFPASSAIVIAKGTTVEETITPTAFSLGQFTLPAPGLAFAHPLGDLVQLAAPPGGKLAGVY
jgi:hypothetical protein